MPVAAIQWTNLALSSEVAVCPTATPSDISILDRGGKLDVSSFSKRSLLELDMLEFGARKEFKFGNDCKFMTVGLKQKTKGT